MQGSVNVHRGALLLVPQWQCISSFVFYILAEKRNNVYLKVYSLAQTWYLSVLKCDCRGVFHSTIWTPYIHKCAYGAHEACFTLKHFDLGNHRNMYLHNARASTDLTLWTSTYTYMHAYRIVKIWPNREWVEIETHINAYFSFQGQYILKNTHMKSAIVV